MDENKALSTETNKINLTFSRDNLQHSILHIWLNHEVRNQSYSQNQGIPEYRMTWRMENSKNDRISTETIGGWKKSKGTVKYESTYLQIIVNMVYEAKKANISFEHVLREAISYKKQLAIDGSLTKYWCLYWYTEIKDSQKFEIVEEFQWRIGFRGDAQKKRKVSGGRCKTALVTFFLELII